MLINVLKSLSTPCAYDHLWSFLARHGSGLKNRWGQPRVSSTLTFVTLFRHEKPSDQKSGGLRLSPIGEKCPNFFDYSRFSRLATASAACYCMSGMTWLYRSSVIPIFEWPRASDTIFGWMFFFNARVAYAWRNPRNEPELLMERKSRLLPLPLRKCSFRTGQPRK